ncbi:hypothetical protein ISN45_Aa01g027680 [Arabidopsis thaliana x Arabidopsis arenosa]|uniref:Uncharacterized protein n=1 Tax=Arabidopsis thaliana x Arabidopsis arenosa TaxID=1240361 RepID=A0A8T2CFH7_9BRAS|nr:hypothetical protein ISN45_Aa01g027680 [Arabidopsis thaliana x Arabidopsis arenosa]
MCLKSSEPPPFPDTHQEEKITEGTEGDGDEKLEAFRSIMRENEALKKKALLLHQENNSLFALLHPKPSPVSTSFL